MKLGPAAALQMLLALICGLLLLLPKEASAEVPEFLFQMPEESTASGEGAGSLFGPRGIGTDSVTGHFFVADSLNRRISEFTPWGIFVKAWGWGVADGATEELQTCTTTCFKGKSGPGAGQFGVPMGVAVDAAGSIYVVDRENQRVQKFSPDGKFLLMFGGGVNQTTGEDICTQADIESGDLCGAGTTGSGAGEFEAMEVGVYLDIGPGGVIYVGDKGRAQKFDSTGAFLGQVNFSGELSTATVRALAVDSTGHLYAAFNGLADVRKFDGVGNLLETIPAKDPVALATDALDGVYVVDHLPGETILGFEEILRYGSDGICTICPGEGFGRLEEKADLSNPHVTGIATNLLGDGSNAPGDVYVSFFRFDVSYLSAYGVLPRFEPAPERIPLIKGQAGGPVGTTTASVSAEINPRFFASTTYYVEYGTSPCEEGGCASVPASPGLPLGSERNAYVRTKPIELEGLEPGTKYFFRFVSVSGKFITKGEGPEAPEASFTTFGGELGPGELLDGRGYELVSPPDKENGEVGSPEPSSGLVSTTVAPQQAALNGEGLTYTSFTSFGEDPKSAPAASQYLSERTSSGWQTNNITPADRESFLADPLRGFSPDLTWGGVIQVDPPLVEGAPIAFENLYIQDNEAETVELITEPTPEITVPQTTYCVGFAGATDDFSHVLLTVKGSLGDGATAGAGQNLYEWVKGQGLRLVSRLPGTNNPAAPTSTTGFGPGANECKVQGAILENVISTDGSKIFWTRGTSPPQLMARVNGTETVRLDVTQGGSGPGGNGVFWRASGDGNFVFLTAQGKLTAGAGNNDLYRYDFSKAAGSRLTNIAKEGQVLGVLDASEDGKRVYFAAAGVLDASEGPTGETAEVGKPNLYLWEEGTGARFIATLEEKDGTNWDPGPAAQTARTTPDGSALTFLSRNSLTDFDNRGQSGGGAPVSEVFLYHAEADELLCASCNPTGARPLGASIVPNWWSSTEQPRYLSDDGSRLFFESNDALDPRDTNGKQDVYEFELAGEGDCTEENVTFAAENGGCLALVSSGKQPAPSLLIDASPSGADVFFSTPEQLTWEDTDQRYDIYDARIDGGFPEPPPPPTPCEGEGCRPAAPAPPAAPPAPPSSTINGAGNVKEGKPKPKPVKCKKGFRKVKKNGKVRCVKKKAKKGARR